MTTHRITIVLVDDHQIVRQGLKAVLAGEPDLAVVGEGVDGIEAISLVEKLNPDVLVLDMMMPGLNGLDVAREVCARFPRTRAVVLSMHADEGYVLEALRNGAMGYVLKGAASSDLVQAVRAAAEGRRYLSDSLSDRALEAYARSQTATTDAYESLSTREREVLKLVGEGASNHEIAERLRISKRTVESHCYNLMSKLSLDSRADMIKYAYKRGLVE
jgi:two-component system, NarL family, response regulator NreC